LDIKVIGAVLGVLVTFGSLFVQVGTIMTRLDNVEARSIPDISNVEKEISIIKKDIEELKAKNSNPLMR
tara:strand:- start:688 stop:894 length:207 start_codon:yes stop_codon:yes gene_type:complete